MTHNQKSTSFDPCMATDDGQLEISWRSPITKALHVSLVAGSSKQCLSRITDEPLAYITSECPNTALRMLAAHGQAFQQAILPQFAQLPLDPVFCERFNPYQQKTDPNQCSRAIRREPHNEKTTQIRCYCDPRSTVACCPFNQLPYSPVSCLAFLLLVLQSGVKKEAFKGTLF